MVKRSFSQLVMFMALFLISALLLLVSLDITKVKAELINGEQVMDNIEIDAQLDDNILTVSATESSHYTYQFWIREKVLTDSALNTYGSIWQMKRDYGASSAEIVLTETDYDEDTLFEVMVRVKNSDEQYFGQIYKVFDLNDLNIAYITTVSIDGKSIYNEIPFIEAASLTNFKILTNVGATSYKIYLNNDEVPIAKSDSEEIKFVSFSGVKAGYHTLTFVAENGGSSAEKTLRIYIYDTFFPAEQPKITSLEGTSDINGLTNFEMTLKYVNDNPINILDKDMFEYRLNIQGKEYVSAEQKIVDGHLVAQFAVDLNNSYGTYQTIGSVITKDSNAASDKIIIYYTGYWKNSGVTLVSNITENHQINNEIIFSAKDGFITDAAGLNYAFYVEDANGWRMLRSYQEGQNFVWTPSRPGTYIFQVRVRDMNSQTWAASSTLVQEIVGDTLIDEMQIDVYDVLAKQYVSTLQAGKPYKIEVTKLPHENALYRFVLTNKNLGNVYLNSFSPLPYVIYTPNKGETLSLSVRAISLSSFGYSDIGAQIKDIVSVVKAAYYQDLKGYIEKDIYAPTGEVNLALNNLGAGSLTYNFTVKDSENNIIDNGFQNNTVFYLDAGTYVVEYNNIKGINISESDLTRNLIVSENAYVDLPYDVTVLSSGANLKANNSTNFSESDDLPASANNGDKSLLIDVRNTYIKAPSPLNNIVLRFNNSDISPFLDSLDDEEYLSVSIKVNLSNPSHQVVGGIYTEHYLINEFGARVMSWQGAYNTSARLYANTWSEMIVKASSIKSAASGTDSIMYAIGFNFEIGEYTVDSVNIYGLRIVEDVEKLNYGIINDFSDANAVELVSAGKTNMQSIQEEIRSVSNGIVAFESAVAYESSEKESNKLFFRLHNLNLVKLKNFADTDYLSIKIKLQVDNPAITKPYGHFTELMLVSDTNAEIGKVQLQGAAERPGINAWYDLKLPVSKVKPLIGSREVLYLAINMDAPEITKVYFDELRLVRVGYGEIDGVNTLGGVIPLSFGGNPTPNIDGIFSISDFVPTYATKSKTSLKIEAASNYNNHHENIVIKFNSFNLRQYRDFGNNDYLRITMYLETDNPSQKIPNGAFTRHKLFNENDEQVGGNWDGGWGTKSRVRINEWYQVVVPLSNLKGLTALANYSELYYTMTFNHYFSGENTIITNIYINSVELVQG